MKPIYEPSGMAREYSPLALNIYMECMHGCKYCYVPHVIHKTAEDYFKLPSPRKDIVKWLQKQLSTSSFDRQVWLSFVSDPYSPSTDNNQTTSEVLNLLNQYNVPVAICTKAGTRALKDLDVFKQFGQNIIVGTTLTLIDEKMSKEWEKGAAMPQDRLEFLKILKQNGIKTHASFEPVIDIPQSQKLIEMTVADDIVAHYKVGKINNYKGMDIGKDWSSYLRQVLKILREGKKEIYLKSGIRKVVSGIEYLPHEIDPDFYALRSQGVLDLFSNIKTG